MLGADYPRFPLGAGEQLFDLEQDPDETVNRVADPACAAVLAGLRERLELSRVPDVSQGAAMTLMLAGLLSLAFMGFAGLVAA